MFLLRADLKHCTSSEPAEGVTHRFCNTNGGRLQPTFDSTLPLVYSSVRVDASDQHDTAEKDCKQCSVAADGKRAVCAQVHDETSKRVFVGEVCNEFSESSYLKAHVGVQSRDRSFSCRVCSKTFRRLANLRRHLCIHTGDRAFQCRVCSKRFAQSSNLRTHMRVHTREKPFSCPVCSKNFSQSGNLQAHMHIHRAERAFECVVCDKKFTQLSQLQAHFRIHTGEKPFSCLVCNKNFRQLSNLQYHSKRIHLGNSDGTSVKSQD